MAEIKLNKRYKYAGDIVKALLNRLQWTLDDTTEFINSIEDADVAEVKHGKWLMRKFYPPSKTHKYPYRFLICSECCEISTTPSIYCSNCGAKMDGGDLNGS